MLASDWAAQLAGAARRSAYRTLEGCALYTRDMIRR